MVKITDVVSGKKNIAYLQDLICNNPLVKEQVINNSAFEIVDQQTDEDKIT